MTDKSNYRGADDAYDIDDNSYVSSDSYPAQVQKDSAPVDDPINARDSNSDATLGMSIIISLSAISKTAIAYELSTGWERGDG
jgi:hypothetical protein